MSEGQHTVPKSYLRGFSTPKGKLRAVDRQRQDTIPITVVNASVVGEIYRIPGTTDEAGARMIETMLSQKEAAAAQILGICSRDRV